MRAKIIKYNEITHSGKLITDDGVTYSFSGYSWDEQQPPKRDESVEVFFSELGIIDRITYLPTQYKYNSSPTLPTTSSSNAYPEGDTIEALYIKENDYGFIDWAFKPFKEFANFEGRARRKEFWFFYLIYCIYMTIIRMFLFLYAFDSVDYELAIQVLIIINLINLIVSIPLLAVTTRRLHDTGRSGWWQLLYFIPLFGWLVMLYFFCQDTSAETNQWGPPARRIN